MKFAPSEMQLQRDLFDRCSEMNWCNETKCSQASSLSCNAFETLYSIGGYIYLYKIFARAFGAGEVAPAARVRKTSFQGPLGAIRVSKTSFQGQLGASTPPKTPFQGQLDAMRLPKTPFQDQVDSVRLSNWCANLK